MIAQHLNLYNLGQPVVFCYVHRLNNVLKLAFYQTSQNREKNVSTTSTTPSKKQLKKDEVVRNSSSDDDTSIEANTFLSDLPMKAKEILSTITTSKKWVKSVKLMSKRFHTTKRLISLSMKLFFFEVGLNKKIKDLGGGLLK